MQNVYTSLPEQLALTEMKKSRYC